MKSVLSSVFALVVLSSTVALADGPDRIRLIQNPRDLSSGLPFQEANYADGSVYNSEDGVCRALGFLGAVANSSQYDGTTRARVLKMNADGTINSQQTDFVMTSIICKDRIGPPLNSGMTVVTAPRYPGTNLPFQEATYADGNVYNSENGICRALGFASAVANSAQYDGTTRTGVLKVDETGGVGSMQNDFAVTQITCMGWVPEHHNARIVEVTAPRYPHSPYPFQEVTYADGNLYNSGDGVCHALGFDRQVANSDRYDGSTRTQVIKVNTDGSVASMQSDFALTSIACFARDL